MCMNFVSVVVSEVRRVPYVTGSGRLRFRHAENPQSYVLQLRCSHGFTEDDIRAGYHAVDQFGRQILCEDHFTFHASID